MATNEVSEKLFDVVIIGAGPAGLSGAINTESEGLETLVVDSAQQLGGQAGTSSLIENYAGFPHGIDGETLTSNIVQQALQFSTMFMGPNRISDIQPTSEGFLVKDGKREFLGRSVLLATGVEFRQLDAPNVAAYLGRGIRYGSPRPRDQFTDEKLFVVGGANSAGQAAMHLSKFTDCKVHLLVRGKSVEDKMSSYLSDRVLNKENIEIHTETEITCVDGDGHLRELHLKTPEGEHTVPADQLFLMIGSEPKTDWMPEEITRDTAGFVVAGTDVDEEARKAFMEQTGRSPLPHETTMPGVFVAGDVRFGTVKRVAGAVGDGAIAVPDLHRYLATLSR